MWVRFPPPAWLEGRRVREENDQPGTQGFMIRYARLAAVLPISLLALACGDTPTAVPLDPPIGFARVQPGTPPTPAGFAGDPSSGTVVLSWTDVTSETSYR